uniref:Serine protease family S15 putative n=1 Tax=Albugo laibachii Nc14 TaxID=890382 RepID=F0WZP2_9STRA|nr:serine protease family S15 putative [Albugo laibachii Nc14]|eukprot:CCA26968.1 serine protease family S15 putative [Albugo laibachii Nc14]
MTEPVSANREAPLPALPALPPAGYASLFTSKISKFLQSGVFSMLTIALASQVGNWIVNRETPITCGTGINDNHWESGRYTSLPFFKPDFISYKTQYVHMSDGIPIAVDSYVSQSIMDMNDTVPTVVQYTRHGRGYVLDFPFTLFSKSRIMNPRTHAYIQRFISSGYAWVAVDVRGSGSSGGVKTHDFSEQEIKDGDEIINWIVKQPWSDGQVAAWGHGFDGIGALLLASTKNSAIKAISLNGSPLDVYRNAFFPGGVKNERAIRDFASFTHDTDRQIRWRHIPTMKARLMMRYFGGNIHPVDDNKTKFDALIAEHLSNPDLDEELRTVHFRDDRFQNSDVTMADLGFARYLPAIAASNVAILSFAGYYDMGVARSAIELHQYMTDTLPEDTVQLYPTKEEGSGSSQHDPAKYRLLLGPWSHAGVDNADPFAQSKQKCFWHLAEISRFFDYHFYPNRRGIAPLHKESPIHYYSIVHHKWKGTDMWPPSHVNSHRVFDLQPNATLTERTDIEGQKYSITYQVDLAIPKNLRYAYPSRWDMVGQLFNIRPNYYHDRNDFISDYLVFETSSLPLMEVTGEITLRFFFSINREHINLAAYIEDIDETLPFKNENKRVGSTYVTEAHLNPIHSPVNSKGSVYSFERKDARAIKPNVVYEAVLSFEPISYIFKRDHRLRLAIGISPSFDFAPPGGENQTATTLRIHFGSEYPSSLQIPASDGLYTDKIDPSGRIDENKETDESNNSMQNEHPKEERGSGSSDPAPEKEEL